MALNSKNMSLLVQCPRPSRSLIPGLCPYPSLPPYVTQPFPTYLAQRGNLCWNLRARPSFLRRRKQWRSEMPKPCRAQPSSSSMLSIKCRNIARFCNEKYFKFPSFGVCRAICGSTFRSVNPCSVIFIVGRRLLRRPSIVCT